MPAIVIVIAGFILIAILIRLMAGALDKDRIERYVEERGWQMVDRSWDPFGPGWFGDKDARIYEIVYRDGQGNVHRAHVKTSLFGGVYLTNDRIVQPAPPPASTPQLSLEEENARLRQRIQELEQDKSKPE
jgi:hypothetical protein